MNFMFHFLFLIPFLLSCSSPIQTQSPPEKPSTRRAPSFYMGIYWNQKSTSNPKERESLLDTMQKLNMNAAVVDVQGKKIPWDFAQSLQNRGIYGIARVVVFEQGLKTEFPEPSHMDSLLMSIRKACEMGFPEINLDYIRYSDGGWKFKASAQQRYNNMKKIITSLKEGSQDSCPPHTIWSADIFGRVPFVEVDFIGQKVEEYSQVVDILYPMLYPSHFYGMPDRQYKPYETISEGILRTKERSAPHTRVVTWVQGFEYYIRGSGLSFKEYIQTQMQAALDSKGDGFIVWNAVNDYTVTWQAFRDFYMQNLEKLKSLR